MEKSLKLGQNSAYLTHWHNGPIVLEYLLRPNNHLLVAYAVPKKIAENLDSIRLLGQKPKLAIIIFSRIFLHATRVGQKLPFDRNSYQTLHLGMNLCSWCPEHHDKAIRDMKKAVKSPFPGILITIYIAHNR